MQRLNKALALSAVLLTTLMCPSHSLTADEEGGAEMETQHATEPAVEDAANASGNLTDNPVPDRDSPLTDHQPKSLSFPEMLPEWPKHLQWEGRAFRAYVWKNNDLITIASIIFARGVSLAVVVSELAVPKCSLGFYDIYSPVFGSEISVHDVISDGEDKLYTLIGGTLTCSKEAVPDGEGGSKLDEEPDPDPNVEADKPMTDDPGVVHDEH